MWKEQGDQSYTNLKNYFDRADENRNEMQTEAGELGYGMGADEFFDAQEDDAATRGFKESLTNLAAAVQANQKTHSQLQQALAAQAQQQQMAAQMQQQQTMQQNPAAQQLAALQQSINSMQQQMNNMQMMAAAKQAPTMPQPPPWQQQQ